MPDDPKRKASRPPSLQVDLLGDEDASVARTVLDVKLQDLIKREREKNSEATARLGPPAGPAEGPTEPGTAQARRKVSGPPTVEINLPPEEEASTAQGEALPLSVEEVEQLTATRLSPRLRAFLEKEASRHEGRFSPALGAARALPLRFLARELSTGWEQLGSRRHKLPGKVVPVAACGRGNGSLFVAVDAGKAALPVWLYDAEVGFSPAAKSLQDFIGALEDEA